MTFDFARARENMIENDVRTNDVTDRRLIAALREVAREAFVPAASQAIAYAGLCVPLGDDRYLLDARTLSKLIQAARVEPSDRVLDVGCGTGYSSAVLARLAGEVVALESHGGLAAAATAALSGLPNVKVVRGDLGKGSPDKAPYDVIFLGGAVEEVPQALTDQLKDGGRLLTVFVRGPAGRGRIIDRVGKTLSGRNLFDATVPPLPGFAKNPTFVF